MVVPLEVAAVRGRKPAVSAASLVAMVAQSLAAAVLVWEAQFL